jgi:hypothetical protein
VKPTGRQRYLVTPSELRASTTLLKIVQESGVSLGRVRLVDLLVKLPEVPPAQEDLRGLPVRGSERRQESIGFVSGHPANETANAAGASGQRPHRRRYVVRLIDLFAHGTETTTNPPVGDAAARERSRHLEAMHPLQSKEDRGGWVAPVRPQPNEGSRL